MSGPFEKIFVDYFRNNDAEACLAALMALPRDTFTGEMYSRLRDRIGEERIRLVVEQPKDFREIDSKLDKLSRILDQVSSAMKRPPSHPEPASESTGLQEVKMSKFEANEFDIYFQFSTKQGFRRNEILYAYSNMKLIFDMFLRSLRKPNADKTEVLNAINSLPEQIFLVDPRNRWFIMTDYMNQFLQQMYLANKDEAHEFRNFFRGQFRRRTGSSGHPPLVTFPASVSITDVELIDRELSNAFDKFYDKEPKLTWAYGCLQRIFQAVLVDEEVRQGLLQAIGSMYMRKNILREARLPNMRDTDFAEFFGWFCTQEGRAADAGSLSKLRVVVKELDRLVTSWGSG